MFTDVKRCTKMYKDFRKITRWKSLNVAVYPFCPNWSMTWSFWLTKVSTYLEGGLKSVGGITVTSEKDIEVLLQYWHGDRRRLADFLTGVRAKDTDQAAPVMCLACRKTLFGLFIQHFMIFDTTIVHRIAHYCWHIIRYLLFPKLLIFENKHN